MRGHTSPLLKDDDMDRAVRVATWGAVNGAARWGLAFGLGSVAASVFSPVYRGLTIQFKVFLWLTGPILGGMLEADARFRKHELEMRAHKRAERDAKSWSRYEKDYGMEQNGERAGDKT